MNRFFRFFLIDANFVLYLAGGVVSALVDIVVMQTMIGSKVAPLLATSVGFGSGLCLNYLFHSRLTFKDALQHTATGNSSLPRYLLVVGFNYMVTLGMVAASLGLLEQALPGKLLSLPVIAVNGYLLGKHWIFK